MTTPSSVLRTAATTTALSALLGLAGCSGEAVDVKPYIALDQEHSERLVDMFAEETGLVVDAQFDIEQNKTVGLVSRIQEEKQNPRCDVFWNNELAQTISLGQQGLLQPYRSPNAEDIPAQFKDADGLWTGFAARARILIVNTELVSADEMPSSMWDLTEPKWKGKCGVAIPLTGTTLTHFAALRVLMGADEFDRWVSGMEENDVQMLQSNGATMKAVADGRLHFAFTDTDDYHVARTKGHPVTCVFPDQGEGQIGTMLIPNSISMIKGAPHPEGARKFIDWVLRRETEKLLAAAKSAQIPVREGIEGPGDESILEIGKFRPMAWDPTATASALAESVSMFQKRFDVR